MASAREAIPAIRILPALLTRSIAKHVQDLFDLTMGTRVVANSLFDMVRRGYMQWKIEWDQLRWLTLNAACFGESGLEPYALASGF